MRGECLLIGLEFLEANDIWICFGEPSHQISQPLFYVIDVEGGDLHVQDSPVASRQFSYSPPQGASLSSSGCSCSDSASDTRQGSSELATVADGFLRSPT